MKKIMKYLVMVETILAAAILTALIVCTFAGVIARYILSAPFTWEEEFQVACMVWITFLAAPIAFHTKSHVAIEILVELFPKKVQRVIEVLIMVIVYVTLIYFFNRSLSFISVLTRTGRATPILHIPYAKIYSVAPVSCILMLISYTYMTITEVFLPKKDNKEEGDAQ